KQSMNLQVINPYNQELVYEIRYDGGAMLEKKIDTACQALEKLRRFPLEVRAQHVRQGIDRFRTAAKEIAREVSLQMGKPVLQAEKEVETCCERAEYMLSIAAKTLASEILPAKEGFHLRI